MSSSLMSIEMSRRLVRPPARLGTPSGRICVAARAATARRPGGGWAAAAAAAAGVPLAGPGAVPAATCAWPRVCGCGARPPLAASREQKPTGRCCTPAAACMVLSDRQARDAIVAEQRRSAEARQSVEPTLGLASRQQPRAFGVQGQSTDACKASGSAALAAGWTFLPPRRRAVPPAPCLRRRSPSVGAPTPPPSRRSCCLHSVLHTHVSLFPVFKMHGNRATFDAAPVRVSNDGRAAGARRGTSHVRDGAAVGSPSRPPGGQESNGGER